MSILKSKIKTTFFHLLISIAVAGAAAGIIVYLWYPVPYDDLCGGLSLLSILISVDVVLGPLLTFVVFNKTKHRSELVRDLFVVGILQLAGLCYGLHTVFLARPVVVVFEDKQFVVVTNAQIPEEALYDAPDGLRQLSLTGPILIGARKAENEKEQSDIIARSMAGDFKSANPKYWQEYSLFKADILHVARPISVLIKQYPNVKSDISGIALKKNVPEKNILFLPIISKRGDATIILDMVTCQPIGYLFVSSYF